MVSVTLSQQADAGCGFVRYLTYYSDASLTEEVGFATVGPCPTGYHLYSGYKTTFIKVEEYDDNSNPLQVISPDGDYCHQVWFTYDSNNTLIGSGEYWTSGSCSYPAVYLN